MGEGYITMRKVGGGGRMLWRIRVRGVGWGRRQMGGGREEFGSVCWGGGSLGQFVGGVGGGVWVSLSGGRGSRGVWVSLSGGRGRGGVWVSPILKQSRVAAVSILVWNCFQEEWHPSVLCSEDGLSAAVTVSCTPSAAQWSWKVCGVYGDMVLVELVQHLQPGLSALLL